MQAERKVVGVVTMAGGAPDSRLLEWLSGNFSVRFDNRKLGELGSLDAVVFIAEDRTGFDQVQDVKLPRLAILNPESPGADVRDIAFRDSRLIPPVFRSRTIKQEVGRISPLPVRNDEEVLATLAGQPVWTTRMEGSHRSDVSAMSLPRVDPVQGANDCLLGRNFFRLLPLVDFIRRVSGESEWAAPPARACFLFDDPNLHGIRYGWLNYPQIVRHAVQHNYHMAFATVPLDGWYASRRSAAFFIGGQSRLSLLMHGNDHVFEELCSFADEQEARSSLAQALRRIGLMEQKTSVMVSHVMAPPHGTCSELALRTMAQLGFEGVCTTLSGLARRNRDRPWTRQLGLHPAEVVAGMPVIARFMLDSMAGNSVLLAAYLGQPIILYGHHQDVASGLGLLDGLADDINSLGGVRWMNLQNISRSNYQTRQRNGCLEVRSYARIIEMTIPPETTALRLERSWLDNQQAEGVRIWSDGLDSKLFPDYGGEPFPVTPGSRLRLESIHPAAIDPNTVRVPKNRIQPFLRRVACECRDRLKPAVHFVQNGNGRSTV